jgi:hypothetical protein
VYLAGLVLLELVLAIQHLTTVQRTGTSSTLVAKEIAAKFVVNWAISLVFHKTREIVMSARSTARGVKAADVLPAVPVGEKFKVGVERGLVKIYIKAT